MAISITTTALPNGLTGQQYQFQLQVSVEPPSTVTWSCTNALPFDLKLDPATGSISGVSTKSFWGSLTFWVRSDKTKEKTHKVLTLHIGSSSSETVPDVVGMTRAAAESAITRASLTVGAVTTKNSATVPAGSIVSQDPAAGIRISTGGAVALVVSEQQPVIAASVKAYSLALSFNSGSVSAGEAITFLDPLTSMNIAMAGDGNGNWRATITCPHEPRKDYEDQPVKPGQTLPVTRIGAVDYSVQFSDEQGQRISSAIRVTITGIPSNG